MRSDGSSDSDRHENQQDGVDGMAVTQGRMSGVINQRIDDRKSGERDGVDASGTNERQNPGQRAEPDQEIGDQHHSNEIRFGVLKALQGSF